MGSASGHDFHFEPGIHILMGVQDLWLAGTRLGAPLLLLAARWVQISGGSRDAEARNSKGIRPFEPGIMGSPKKLA